MPAQFAPQRLQRADVQALLCRIVVRPLADYSAVPGEEEPGIVLGYAGTSDTLLAEGLARIRAAILDQATPSG